MKSFKVNEYIRYSHADSSVLFGLEFIKEDS